MRIFCNVAIIASLLGFAILAKVFSFKKIDKHLWNDFRACCRSAGQF